jgi:dipeptidyl aminopeptidase/acylaminoacyl peptidase
MTQTCMTAQDLYNIVTLSDPRFGPDGKWLAFVRTEMSQQINDYQSAIWLAPTDGSRPRQFTSGDKRDAEPRWSSDGRWLAFVSNRGADKAKAQIYLIPTDGGEARKLTKMENGAGEPAWSPDGKCIAFTSRLNAEEMAAEADPEPETPLTPDEIKRRNEEKEKKEKDKADPRLIARFAYRAGTSYADDRTKHLYIVDIDPETGQSVGKPRRLTQDERDYNGPVWMPGGKSLLATVGRKPGEDDLFYYRDVVRVPLNGGEPEILTGPDTEDYDPRPSPNGRWIAYNSVPTATYSSANIEIHLMPAGGGEPQVLTAALDAHAGDLRWTPDGNALYFLVPEWGRVDLRRVSLETGSVETVLTADRVMQAYDLSPDGNEVGFVASTDRAPSDLYLASLAGSAEQRLTEVNGEWLAERDLGAVEDLWFESVDGTPIQAWIIKPPRFDPGDKYPLILSIHGGPHVMWSRHELTMWHEWQMQAASGYVVLACNPRGSDGYGLDFRSTLLNHWGEADLPDLMAGLDQVIAKGFVDPERLVVTGGSYGGFMTAWVIGHSDRFKAAVAQRGVYDLSSFFSTTDIPLLTEWEFAATPWEDPERLWQYSPLAHVEQIHTPLLLIHSEYDYRAPIPTAEGLFVALRRLKREVEMARYPRDGHELSRSGEPKHRVDRLERIVGWFDRHVRDAEDEA